MERCKQVIEPFKGVIFGLNCWQCLESYVTKRESTGYALETVSTQLSDLQTISYPENLLSVFVFTKSTVT